MKTFLATSLVIAYFLVTPSESHAYRESTFSLGVGYYSQNAFRKITKDPSASPSMTGSMSIPLLAQYEWNLGENFYFAPRLAYTPIARKSAGDATETTLMHVVLPFGWNFAENSSSVFDASVGLGYARSSIKGSGGLVTLNNGTGSATFAKPAGTSVAQTLFLNFAVGWTYSSMKYGFEIDVEGPLSNDKRTASFMLNALYRFGDSL